jgi:hypothetical protein
MARARRTDGDVLDELGINAGAGDDALEDGREQVLWAHVLEAT